MLKGSMCMGFARNLDAFSMNTWSYTCVKSSCRGRRHREDGLNSNRTRCFSLGSELFLRILFVRGKLHRAFRHRPGSIGSWAPRISEPIAPLSSPAIIQYEAESPKCFPFIRPGLFAGPRDPEFTGFWDLHPPSSTYPFAEISFGMIPSRK